MHAEPAILVALATYNELENLPSLVAAIHDGMPKADVRVVDDGSPDGTGEWCRDFAERHRWFTVEHRQSKQGLGSAIVAAMRFAVAEHYDLLITMDADWSHAPHYLPQLVDGARQADMVIGSRYCAGGSIEGWPWRRRVASRLVNYLTRLLLGIPVCDCSGNFRVYKTTLLGQMKWDVFRATGYGFLEEAIWHLHRLDASMTEVPVVFTDRQRGISKINWREALGAMATLLRLTWRRMLSG
ncbi:MAG: polyprenol monophosphomannose synthase [Pirellulales bacterium]|nr:polyprenol monophosphomannose synthase [Pirellulales bacterium]